MNRVEHYPIPPNTHVTKYKCVQLMIPDDFYYEAMFRGQIWALCQWYTYDRDTAHSGSLVANIWKTAYDTIRYTCEGDLQGGDCGDDCMGCCLRFQDGKLQMLNCGVWEDVPGQDVQRSSGTQPGNNPTPPQPGQCQDFIASLNFGGTWLLPNAVYTGDTIEVRNANGAWASYVNDAPIWRCPDGNIFIGGGCVGGTEITSGADPAPALPHDALIAFDGTNYYDCSAAATGGGVVTITIPSGVSGGQITFIANNGSNVGAGSISFDAKYCNNGSGSWLHTYDLTVGKGPLAAEIVGGTTYGVWIPGVGWQSVGGGSAQQVTLDITHLAHLTRVSFALNVTSGIASPDHADILTDAGATSLLSVPLSSGIQTVFVAPIATDTLTTINAFNNTGGGGGMTITAFTIEGTGPDPF